jgi:hypothetical protein
MLQSSTVLLPEKSSLCKHRIRAERASNSDQTRWSKRWIQGSCESNTGRPIQPSSDGMRKEHGSCLRNAIVCSWNVFNTRLFEVWWDWGHLVHGLPFGLLYGPRMVMCVCGKEPKYSEKTCYSASWSTTNPTWPDLHSNPCLDGGTMANNLLSYATALYWELSSL